MREYGHDNIFKQSGRRVGCRSIWMELSIRIFIWRINDASALTQTIVTSYEKPLQRKCPPRKTRWLVYRTYLLLIGIVIRTRSGWLADVGLAGYLAAGGAPRSNAWRNAVSAMAIIATRTSSCNRIGLRMNPARLLHCNHRDIRFALL